MEALILELFLAGGLDDVQILPWLRETKHSIELPDAVTSKLQQQQPKKVQATSQLQPDRLRDTVLNTVRQDLGLNGS